MVSLYGKHTKHEMRTGNKQWIQVHSYTLHSQGNCNLLLGFFAHTRVDEGLGSPDPDSFIAETLNSYSTPSVISLTAHFTSER